MISQEWASHKIVLAIAPTKSFARTGELMPQAPGKF